MRDIRDDLQERANQIAEQISTAQGEFDKHIEQLRHEHETMLEDLRSALRSVHMVIGIENRLESSLAGTQGDIPPRPHLTKQAQPPQPLSDSLIRKVASVGTR
jgi:hypothetical protein